MAKLNKMKRPNSKQKQNNYKKNHRDSLGLAAGIVESTASSPDIARRLSGGRSIRASSIKQKRST